MTNEEKKELRTQLKEFKNNEITARRLRDYTMEEKADEKFLVQIEAYAEKRVEERVKEIEKYLAEKSIELIVVGKNPNEWINDVLNYVNSNK